MRRVAVLGLCLLAWAVASAVSNAAILLSFDPPLTPLVAGSSSLIRLKIQGTASENIDLFSLNASISGGGGLIFDPIQPFPQPGDYIFGGNSLVESSLITVGSAAGTTFGANDQTFDFIPEILNGSQQTLLWINLLAVTAGNYDLSLTAASFASDQNDPVATDIPPGPLPTISLTVAPGLAAVPEPGFGVLTVLGIVALGWKKRRGRRQVVSV